jgi:L-alanine-DL-glutamate epimerase-like enolase superfamily enzyme
LRITAIETIQLAEFSNLLWVRVHTDEGPVGLGETFFGADAVASYVHESVAPQLLGEDALAIDHYARKLYGYVGFKSTGVESRGNSAIDMALWDLLGKVTAQPVYQLLGGASRDRIRIYNTCAGYGYMRSQPRQSVDNWGLPSGGDGGPYEDLDAFLNRPADLARSLLDQGITGMKIWPFDRFAEETNGQYISAADIENGLRPIRAIRDAVGETMDVMVEFHSLWSAPVAERLMRALEPFKPFWFEDPVKADDLAALAGLARALGVPITASETLGSRWAFRDVLERRATDIVMFDVAWTGGVGEAKKIASMAEAYNLPVAPHDCTGPVGLMASVHLCINLPNAMIQETVRAFYAGWYRELVTDLPRIDCGHVYAPTGPGLGTELLPGLTARPDATVRTSSV